MGARPFLKWAGGKTQLLPELLKRAPADFATYREPFLGGGAVFFALGPKRAVLSDVNAELVTTYIAVRDSVEEVIGRLQSFQEHHSPKLFDTLRKERADRGLHFDTAARMIYLNKTCFNGLYRVNASGEFNVPMGRFKTPPAICDAENLRACSVALQGIEILCGGFGGSLQKAEPGDFVYCDPPFVPTSPTAYFTSYSAGGFSIRRQAELAIELERLKARGVHVLASNANHRLVRELYEGFKLEKVRARRNINSKGEKRGPVGEYLIS